MITFLFLWSSLFPPHPPNYITITNEGFRLGSPTRNGIILVVPVTAWEVVPTYSFSSEPNHQQRCDEDGRKASAGNEDHKKACIFWQPNPAVKQIKRSDMVWLGATWTVTSWTLVAWLLLIKPSLKKKQPLYKHLKMYAWNLEDSSPFGDGLPW